MEKKSQTRTITSQHTDWPLSFRCPTDWTVRDLTRPGRVKFFLRGPLDPEEVLFASIIVEAGPATAVNLSQLVRELIQRRTACRTCHILARTETNLAGCEAVQLDAAHQMPLPTSSPKAKMITIRERIILALRDDKIYQLCYRAVQDDFEANLPVFEALVASFSL